MSCTVEECGRPTVARGWCKRHYATWSRTGSPISRVYACAHIEDVEWMAETGESWLGACARLGAKPETLAKLLERNGRQDLIAALRGRCVA